jgi:hypothetical protein
MLEIKLRGRRPRGRPRTRWMDQVKRDVEKRGRKCTHVQQDRKWGDRHRWRFLYKSTQRIGNDLRKKNELYQVFGEPDIREIKARRVKGWDTFLELRNMTFIEC